MDSLGRYPRLNKSFFLLHSLQIFHSICISALANFHTGLVNMKIYTARTHPKLDRRIDPGSGAFSDLTNSAFRSSYPISAGEELFVSYGERWLIGRPEFKDVPLLENFREVDQIAASIWSMLQLEGAAAIRREAVGHLLETVKNSMISNHRTKGAMNNVLDLERLELLLQRNGTAKMTVEARSQTWLDTHGFCLDHSKQKGWLNGVVAIDLLIFIVSLSSTSKVYVKDSTLSQAGKGAFSRRSLKSGTVIHTSPVIATPRHLLENMDNNTQIASINSKQLLINYHFGHSNSTILFLPLTQMIAINHNTARTKHGTAPNARVEFSTHESKTRYLLQRSLVDIFAERYSSLLLDVIATRDIAPDEEVQLLIEFYTDVALFQF
jgi:hypothetical protein